ncbi:hypothetical protein TRFO_24414 [Tritrichomonas foetus]|uniref:Adenylate and Guanylate cyclase catalytic domain containing protein n=1 Tax=Tritrichomonas foetus TaxID=1144522 RepID=A0A1J4KCM2_9EUKA|nr:hypothetical protein TRFO_24414 [Tritrichomonas foetus]|eukprot:OHT07398.1 hypothetical protein TRFO_24414 [Tritrichomonas foetus]
MKEGVNYDPGSSVMPFDESSRASRRTISVAYTSKTTIDSSSTVFDVLFPIIDELSRCSPPNSILIFIEAYLACIQSFITAYFPFLFGTWDFSKYPDKILRYLAYTIDFGCGDPEIFKTRIPSSLIIVIDALILVWTSIVVLYYQWNKTFLRYSIHITRFLFSFLVPLLLFPSCFNIGFSFNNIFDDPLNSSIHIVTTVFGFFFFIVILFLFYIDLIFRSATPYLEDTILAMWDGLPIFYFMLGNSIAILSSRLIEGFPTWSRYFLLCCFIAYVIYVVNIMTYMPMIKHLINVSFINISTSGLFAALFQMLPIPSIYRLVLPIVILVISFPIELVFFKIYRRKIAEHPDISTQNKCLRTIRIFIADRCEEFVSWKLIRNITAQCPTTTVLARIAQVLSFFPSESQLLNLYVSLLSKRNDLLFHERFMFYQIRRVHVLRQSSTSKQLNEDLAEVSKATGKAIAAFSQFLTRTVEDRQSLSIDSLSGLSNLNRVTNSACREALEKYPNSSRLVFVYSRYLIECFADFREGVKLHQKAILIERGRRAAVDYAFRAMANLFPTYLTKRILDSKGKNILNRRRGEKSGSSISGGSRSMCDMDFEPADDIESRVLDKPRLRFALRKAVNNIKCDGIKILTASAVARFCLTILFSIIILLVATSFFTIRKDNFKMISQIGVVRHTLDLTILRLAHFWATELKMIPSSQEVLNALGISTICEQYINLTHEPISSIHKEVLNLMNEKELLGCYISLVSIDKTDSIISEVASTYLEDQPIYFCTKNGSNIVESQGSHRYMSFYLASRFIKSTEYIKRGIPPTNWLFTDSICEIVGNTFNIAESLQNQSDRFIIREEEASLNMEKNILIEYCTIIPLIILLFLIPFSIGFHQMNKEFQHIFDVLNLMPIEVYKEASRPIAPLPPNGSDISQETSSPVEPRMINRVLIPIFAFLSTFLTVLMIFTMIYQMQQFNHRLLHLNQWLALGSQRTPLLLESMIHTYYAAIFGYLGDTNYTTYSYHWQMFIEKANELMAKHHLLIWGDNTFTSCNNFDSRLDEIHYTDLCSIDPKTLGLHQGYICLSTDQLLMVFLKFASDLNIQMRLANDFKDILRHPLFIHFQHIGISHLLNKLAEAQSILNDGMNIQIEALSGTTLIVTAVTMVVALVLFIIEMVLINQMKESFQILLILIARLPPLAVVQSHSLVELITGHNDSEENRNVNPSHAKIKNSTDAYIVINDQCIIKDMNNVTSNIFGYTREQMLNCQIHKLVSPESAVKIVEAIEKRSLEPQHFIIIGIKDDTNEIVLKTIVFYIPNDNVFVLSLTDQTLMYINREKIEEECKKTEILLNQVIPSQIIERVRNQEKNISFSAKIVTCLSLKIVNFDEYIPSLSGKQIVANLSAVFNAFDSLRKDFNTLTKIKVMNNCYQVVAGVFHQELDPSVPAHEIISYTIECLRALEEINHTIESNLMLAIGIHTGGPMTVGIMGKEMLLFEVLGECLKWAVYVGEVAENNVVTITTETNEYIKESQDFVITENKKITLISGKEKMIYTVTPNEQHLEAHV